MGYEAATPGLGTKFYSMLCAGKLFYSHKYTLLRRVLFKQGYVGVQGQVGVCNIFSFLVYRNGGAGAVGCLNLKSYPFGPGIKNIYLLLPVIGIVGDGLHRWKSGSYTFKRASGMEFILCGEPGRGDMYLAGKHLWGVALAARKVYGQVVARLAGSVAEPKGQCFAHGGITGVGLAQAEVYLLRSFPNRDLANTLPGDDLVKRVGCWRWRFSLSLYRVPVGWGSIRNAGVFLCRALAGKQGNGKYKV